jgi:hypothetical protein
MGYKGGVLKGRQDGFQREIAETPHGEPKRWSRRDVSERESAAQVRVSFIVGFDADLDI